MAAKKKDKDQTETAEELQPASGVTPKASPKMPFRLVSQYIADLSFENPMGMESLKADPENPPEVRLNVNLKNRQVQPGQFEVLLIVNAKTERQGKTLFIGFFSRGPIGAAAFSD